MLNEILEDQHVDLDMTVQRGRWCRDSKMVRVYDVSGNLIVESHEDTVVSNFIVLSYIDGSFFRTTWAKVACGKEFGDEVKVSREEIHSMIDDHEIHQNNDHIIDWLLFYIKED